MRAEGGRRQRPGAGPRRQRTGGRWADRPGALNPRLHRVSSQREVRLLEVGPGRAGRRRGARGAAGRARGRRPGARDRARRHRRVRRPRPRRRPRPHAAEPAVWSGPLPDGNGTTITRRGWMRTWRWCWRRAGRPVRRRACCCRRPRCSPPRTRCTTASAGRPRGCSPCPSPGIGGLQVLVRSLVGQLRPVVLPRSGARRRSTRRSSRPRPGGSTRAARVDLARAGAGRAPARRPRRARRPARLRDGAARRRATRPRCSARLRDESRRRGHVVRHDRDVRRRVYEGTALRGSA